MREGAHYLLCYFTASKVGRHNAHRVPGQTLASTRVCDLCAGRQKVVRFPRFRAGLVPTDPDRRADAAEPASPAPALQTGSHDDAWSQGRGGGGGRRGWPWGMHRLALIYRCRQGDKAYLCVALRRGAGPGGARCRWLSVLKAPSSLLFLAGVRPATAGRGVSFRQNIYYTPKVLFGRPWTCAHNNAAPRSHGQNVAQGLRPLE